jgi:hypothetical protein
MQISVDLEYESSIYGVLRDGRLRSRVLFPARDALAIALRASPGPATLHHYCHIIPSRHCTSLHCTINSHSSLPQTRDTLNKPSYPQPWASSASVPLTIRLSLSPASAPSQRQIRNRLCTAPEVTMEPWKWMRRHLHGRMPGTSRVQVESRAAIGETGRVNGCAITGLMSARYMVRLPCTWRVGISVAYSS